ncbi:helix-turn-helix domain-containing protein [Rhizobium tropici]|uniref:Helix-turn-helix domain-containing protein n=1 Tax=Rhizobium tropici TaxID=398 RepID=A0A5B0VT96_RHITR|nr:helix-turn-helix transcriptional regulator [Rhizobium tropici]KAA1176969.1 helix-turn-helix domain-containing protein [Rhizobium tropici]
MSKLTSVQRPETVWLGELIRSRRRGRFSIESLAQRSGISAGLLSEIERGKGNPSFSTLLKLAEALEMDPVEFFRISATAWKDERVVKKAERQRMSFADGRLVEILSPRLDLPLIMWKAIYPIGFDGSGRPITMPAETCLVITRGQLIIEQPDGDTLYLNQGDSFRLEAGSLFGPRNSAPDITEAIGSSLVSPL